MPSNDEINNKKEVTDLIRQRIERIYGTEPSASQELNEIKSDKNISKHQKFIEDLNKSGLDLASIQTKWHEYYISLPEEEQYQVWQEFYDKQSELTKQPVVVDHQVSLAEQKSQVARSPRNRPTAIKKPTKDIQSAIKDKVTAGGKLKLRHQVQSILFGLGVGFIVVFVFLFSFFNEVIVAPFIQPGKNVSTPIIIGNNNIAPTTTDEVIIPKINVEIPVNYSNTSTNENVIENDLESGVVHYPTTVMPGQDGNSAFFGHSSNNIFNPGQYKFAFVLLHTLVPGDTFYLTYNDKVYVYKVITKNIVSPSDVYVLNAVANQTATATLITCDPPGTSINRLVVVGQQISPDPNTNTQATTVSAQAAPTSLPGNGPTLFTRFTRSFLGKVIIVVLIGSIILFAIRRINYSKFLP